MFVLFFFKLLKIQITLSTTPFSAAVWNSVLDHFGLDWVIWQSYPLLGTLAMFRLDALPCGIFATCGAYGGSETTGSSKTMLSLVNQLQDMFFAKCASWATSLHESRNISMSDI